MNPLKTIIPLHHAQIYMLLLLMVVLFFGTTSVAFASCAPGEKSFGVWSEKEAKEKLQEIVKNTDACADERIRILPDGYLCLSTIRQCKTDADRTAYGCGVGKIAPKLQIVLPKDFGGKTLNITKCNRSTITSAIEDVFNKNMNGKGVQELTKQNTRAALQEAVLKMGPRLKEVANGGTLTQQEQEIFKTFGISPEQATQMIKQSPADTQRLLEGLAIENTAAVQQAGKSLGSSVTASQLASFQNNASRLGSDQMLAAAQVFNPQGVRSVMELQCATAGGQACSLAVPTFAGGSGSTFSPDGGLKLREIGTGVTVGVGTGGTSGSGQRSPVGSAFAPNYTSYPQGSYSPYGSFGSGSGGFGNISSMISGLANRLMGSGGSSSGGSSSSNSSTERPALPILPKPSVTKKPATPVVHPTAAVIINPSRARPGESVRLTWGVTGLPSDQSCTMKDERGFVVGGGVVGSRTIAVPQDTVDMLEFVLDCGIVNGERVGASASVSI